MIGYNLIKRDPIKVQATKSMLLQAFVDRDRVPVTLVCIKPKISTHDYFARCCEEWTRPSLEESITFIVDSLPEINKHKIEKVDWKKEGF